jgi:hypothetical protein
LTAANESRALIDDLVARGVFRATPLPAGKPGRAAWRITWFGGHTMRLQAGGREVLVDEVLPPLPVRSALYRDLRAWLRTQQSEALPAHRRLDPARYALEIRNRGGNVRLRLRSAREPLPVLTNRAVQLVNALYHDFLGGPGRLGWVIEAFNLDPDNPRLC